MTAEEVFELKIALPDVVSMQCRQPSLEGTGEIKLRRLVKEALRMRPSRIIVGEVRQEESLDLLIALHRHQGQGTYRRRTGFPWALRSPLRSGGAIPAGNRGVFAGLRSGLRLVSRVVAQR